MTTDISPTNSGLHSTTPPASAPASASAPARQEGASIGPKTHIKGDLQAEENLLVEGKFSGTLVLRNNQLTIGSQGHVAGTAYASIVIVEGSIEGDLYAAERISIRKGAKVQGSVLSPRVSLEDGATLRGSVEMDPKAIADAIKAKFGELGKDQRMSDASNANAPQPAPAPAPAPALASVAPSVPSNQHAPRPVMPFQKDAQKDGSGPSSGHRDNEAKKDFKSESSLHPAAVLK